MTNDEAIEKFRGDGWALFISDSFCDALVVEKIDEENKFEDDTDASMAALEAGVPFIVAEGVEPYLYVDTIENRKLLGLEE